MKKNYFIFYGSAVAYCISMLAAMQIGSLSTTSLAVQKSAVSLCYSDKTDCSENYVEYAGKDKVVNSTIEPRIPAVSNVFPKIYTDREQQKNKMSFKNIYHMETGSIEAVRPTWDQDGSLKKMLSLMTSDRLYKSYHYSDLLSTDMEIHQYINSTRYSVKDSKSRTGFDFIIEFPDKLS